MATACRGAEWSLISKVYSTRKTVKHCEDRGTCFLAWQHTRPLLRCSSLPLFTPHPISRLCYCQETVNVCIDTFPILHKLFIGCQLAHTTFQQQWRIQRGFWGSGPLPSFLNFRKRHLDPSPLYISRPPCLFIHLDPHFYYSNTGVM